MHYEMERLVALYDRGRLSRRQLLQGLFALSVGPYVDNPLASAPRESDFRYARFARKLLLSPASLA